MSADFAVILRKNPDDSTNVIVRVDGIPHSANFVNGEGEYIFTAEELANSGDTVRVEVQQGNNPPQSQFMPRVKPGAAALAPSVISPANGSTLDNSTLTLVFDPGANAAGRSFRIDLSENPQPTVDGVWGQDQGNEQVTGTDRITFNNLRTGGNTIYGRIRYSDANWQDRQTTVAEGRYVDFQYTEHTSSVVVTPPPTAGGSWAPDELIPLPSNRNWTLLDSHDRGHMTPSWDSSKRRTFPFIERRVEFEDAPDGRPCFRHVVDKDDNQAKIVHPLGFTAPAIDVNMSSVTRLLFRYHHWLDASKPYSGIEGKIFSFNWGQGMIGSAGFAYKGQENVYGPDGGGVNTMHPHTKEGSGKNGMRLLASQTRMSRVQGSNFGNQSKPIPTGRWLTVEVEVNRNFGYSLRVDGVDWSGSPHPCNPMMAKKWGYQENWEECYKLWYRIRLMHGGTPAELPAVKDQLEYFGGFFVLTS